MPFSYTDVHGSSWEVFSTQPIMEFNPTQFIIRIQPNPTQHKWNKLNSWVGQIFFFFILLLLLLNYALEQHHHK